MRTTSVSRWPVWGERKRSLALIAVVEVLALVLPTTLWSSLTPRHMEIGVSLVGLSLCYSQVAFGWERVRRVLLFRRLPSTTPNVQATWCLAAALLLPPALAAVVTGLCRAGAWKTYNPAGTRRPYRFVYSTLVDVLAATLCSWVTHSGGGGELLVVAVAAVLWMVTTWGATALAMAAACGLRTVRSTLDPRAHALVLATVVLAVGGYYASRLALPALALSVPAAIGVQRLFARAELRALDAQEATARLRAREAQEVVDSLMTEAAWVFVAEVLVEEYTCSLIRVEVASDLENLAEAVRALTEVQVGNELVGRYGPSGIAVMLPGGSQQAAAMALRLATALANRGVVSCRLASASSSPRDGLTVHGLLAICEAELALRSGQTAESEHG